MTDFERLLNDVVRGKSNLAPVRTWLDKNLSLPGCNHAALITALESAANAGLSDPVVQAIRTHIQSVAPSAPPAAGGDFPFELDEPPAAKGGKAAAEKTVQIAKGPTGKASAEKTQITHPAAAEKTQLSGPPETTRRAADRTATAPDRTTLQSPATEASVTMGADQGRTVITHTGGTEDPTSRGRKKASETDPFAMDSQPTSGQNRTGTSWRTSTGLKASGGPDNVGPGTVLKDRFELMDVLGEGGMGKVYKARDLLKVEAKDKNPYIAVKTLTGDFKQHPESFISLQRESSKAQRLAHPNIATVFDFDRDGSMVYMTMELMEGDELAKYIKHLPAGGLPVPDAMRIIKQLCDGLAYAHSKQLVHSDFKPGNAFMLKDGTVKLLDFGIARASKTRKDTQGETTVFDPGQLGALTPAYATVEMFEGMDPDQRDDIYALACVAYELLTGKHPFNKLSAPKVLEKGLKPAPVAKLTKAQNRALMRGLALRRDDRTPSVEEFWEGIRPRKDRTKQIAAGAVAAIILFVVLGYYPIRNQLRQNRANQLIAQVQSPNADIPGILKTVALLDTDSAKLVYNDTNAGKSIRQYFVTKAETAINQSKGQYNYAMALESLKTATDLYPDSNELAAESTSINQRKAQLISQLTTDFNTLMNAGKLMPGNGPNITDTIKILRVTDPANAMLKDARLANRYAQMVQSAVKDGDYSQANSVLGVGLDYAPTDAALNDLQDQVKRELKREQDATLVAQLENKLKAAAPNLRTLADFDKSRGDMLKLQGLSTNDATLQHLKDPLKAALAGALTAAANQKKWDDAENTLYAYSHLLSISDLLAQRQALSTAEAGTYVPSDMQAHVSQVKQHRDTITAMLGAPKPNDPDWDIQLLGQVQETTALLQPNEMDWYQTMRDDVAKTYIKLSQTMLQQNRFDAAASMITSGQLYNPELADFKSANDALAQAEQNFKQAQAEKLRVASIDASKNQFQTQLNAGQLEDAKKTEAALRQNLPANDPFFADVVPKAYAGAYLGMARGRAASGDYRGAVTLVKQGLNSYQSDDLKKALQDYTAQESKGDLFTMVDTLQPSAVGELKTRLADVVRQFPKEQTQINETLSARLVKHIDGLKDTDAGLAYDLWNAVKAAFPDNAQIANLKISPPARPSKFAAQGRDAMKQNDLSKAQSLFEQGQQQEAGNQDLAQFGDTLKTAQGNAQRYYLAYQQYMQAGQAQQAQAYLNQALSMWTDNAGWQSEYKKNFATAQQPTRSANGGRPCSADLAGYGKDGRGACYDMVDGSTRGPTMVVVPAGGNVSQAFAIGKYEVSVSDFNTYCRASGSCTPIAGEGDMPATNVSFNDAKAYAAWLSQKSSAHYFIPSFEQWQYAASVGGTDSSRDFNCHLELAGSVLKGLSVVSSQTGHMNAWGLVNYVGNVQQFVTANGGVAAAGGDYQDPLAECTTSLSRPSSGSADPLTGFRVARDLNQ